MRVKTSTPSDAGRRGNPNGSGGTDDGPTGPARLVDVDVTNPPDRADTESVNHERTHFWLLRFLLRVTGSGLLPRPLGSELHPLLERLRLGAGYEPARARGR